MMVQWRWAGEVGGSVVEWSGNNSATEHWSLGDEGSGNWSGNDAFYNWSGTDDGLNGDGSGDDGWGVGEGGHNWFADDVVSVRVADGGWDGDGMVGDRQWGGVCAVSQTWLGDGGGDEGRQHYYELEHFDFFWIFLWSLALNWLTLNDAFPFGRFRFYMEMKRYVTLSFMVF